MNSQYEDLPVTTLLTRRALGKAHFPDNGWHCSAIPTWWSLDWDGIQDTEMEKHTHYSCVNFTPVVAEKQESADPNGRREYFKIDNNVMPCPINRYYRTW